MSESTLNEKCEKLAIGIEKKFGFEVLTKLTISTLNKILVEKGITTKDELCIKFMKEAQKFVKENKNKSTTSSEENAQ